VLLPYATLFYLIVVPFGLGIPVVLAVAGDRLRLQRFVLATTITVFVICAISLVVPAMGAYFYHGLDTHVTGLNTGGYTVQLERLPFVRDGSLRVLELSQMAGSSCFRASRCLGYPERLGALANLVAASCRSHP
jgi:hypothetical protein